MKYQLFAKDKSRNNKWVVSGYHSSDGQSYFTSLNKAFKTKAQREKSYPSSKFKVANV